MGELVTGTQLDQLFASRGLVDVSGQSTKWRRIHISLLARQQADRCGNNVAAFIMAVMAPGRHVTDQGCYEAARSSLNLTACILAKMVNLGELTRPPR